MSNAPAPAGAAAQHRAVLVRSMEASDWPVVHAIYTAGISTGQATFESQAPDWESFNTGHLSTHRFVAHFEADAVGWAAVSAVSSRTAYQGVVEHSVYVDPGSQGRGIGKALLRALVDSTEAAGIWTIQASIFAENAASLALHRAEGFRIIGKRERVAKMEYGPAAGLWRDTLLLERRSAISGTD